MTLTERQKTVLTLIHELTTRGRVCRVAAMTSLGYRATCAALVKIKAITKTVSDGVQVYQLTEHGAKLAEILHDFLGEDEK